jgi:hypothetical protein
MRGTRWEEVKRRRRVIDPGAGDPEQLAAAESATGDVTARKAGGSDLGRDRRLYLYHVPGPGRWHLPLLWAFAVATIPFIVNVAHYDRAALCGFLLAELVQTTRQAHHLADLANIRASALRGEEVIEPPCSPWS